MDTTCQNHSFALPISIFICFVSLSQTPTSGVKCFETAVLEGGVSRSEVWEVCACVCFETIHGVSRSSTTVEEYIMPLRIGNVPGFCSQSCSDFLAFLLYLGLVWILRFSFPTFESSRPWGSIKQNSLRSSTSPIKFHHRPISTSNHPKPPSNTIPTHPHRLTTKHNALPPPLPPP